MEVIVQKTYEEMSKVAAAIVVEVLNTKPNAVLGILRVHLRGEAGGSEDVRGGRIAFGALL